MASMFKRLWILTIHSFFCHSFRVYRLWSILSSNRSRGMIYNIEFETLPREALEAIQLAASEKR